MKKIISTLLAVMMILSVATILSGCATQDKPRESVRTFINSLSAGKWTAADNVCDKSIFSTDYFSYSKNMARLFLDNEDIKAEIMKGVYLKVAMASEIHGDSATVKAEIAAYDLPTLLEDYMALVMLNGDSSKNRVDIKKVVPAMLEGTDIVTKEIEIELKKQDDKWVIVTSEELADAITGGLASCTSDDEKEETSSDDKKADEDSKSKTDTKSKEK
jgi:hypothetical protein